MALNDPSTVNEPKSSTPVEVEFRLLLEDYYRRSQGSFNDKLKSFPKFVPRQHLATFLAKYEIFKRVIGIHGSIVECGVYNGGGLFTFAQVSAILEPINHQRRIVGFDTFEGFSELMPEDQSSASVFARKGGMKADSFEDILEAIRLFDMNRALGHMTKVELVRGDIRETVPRYLRENPHTVISLLYLDLDIYEPTKIALELFLPRMPKGAIVAFDELNRETWPGETVALSKTIGIRSVRLQRFTFEPNICYFVVE
ncbi:MAG: class I SAM-dependent methyltransferase [Candidatus Omnitrophica bacterium]|nr:class I SAM-dependent methyltransferase [Candidatus Omnitrophota bacterium]